MHTCDISVISVDAALDSQRLLLPGVWHHLCQDLACLLCLLQLQQAQEEQEIGKYKQVTNRNQTHEGVDKVRANTEHYS